MRSIEVTGVSGRTGAPPVHPSLNASLQNETRPDDLRRAGLGPVGDDFHRESTIRVGGCAPGAATEDPKVGGVRSHCK